MIYVGVGTRGKKQARVMMSGDQPRSEWVQCTRRVRVPVAKLYRSTASLAVPPVGKLDEQNDFRLVKGGVSDLWIDTLDGRWRSLLVDLAWPLPDLLEQRGPWRAWLKWRQREDGARVGEYPPPATWLRWEQEAGQSKLNDADWAKWRQTQATTDL